MKFKRLLTFALAATLSFSALTGCGTTNPDSTSAADTTKTDSSKTNITLGYLPITHALAVFETKELLDKKSDSDIEVTLQKFSSWTDLMDALNSGKIDGASVLVELAMGAVSNGIDLKAAALGHKDGNVVIVSDDISDVRDLKGKTFAIPSNQSSHNILLNDMLALGDLSIDDINVVQLAPSEMPSSLASDSTDLWQDSICCALVFNGGFLDKNKEAADEFLSTYKEAGSLLDEGIAKEVAEKYLGQDEKTLDVSLEWIHYDDLDISLDDYEQLSEKVKEYGINDNPPSYNDFIYQ